MEEQLDNWLFWCHTCLSEVFLLRRAVSAEFSLGASQENRKRPTEAEPLFEQDCSIKAAPAFFGAGSC